jgi:6-phosphogluconolactonase
MVRESWLDKVGSLGTVKPWSILDSAQASAAEYEHWLRLHRPDGVDLCLLGMGDDGHTASLFPGTRALTEEQLWAVVNWVEKFQAPRLTLTYPYLNLSREVLFLITGANKALPLKQMLEEHQHPTAGVVGQEGTYYFLDREAASQLSWPPKSR